MKHRDPHSFESGKTLQEVYFCRIFYSKGKLD